jgi:hypothetical protein
LARQKGTALNTFGVEEFFLLFGHVGKCAGNSQKEEEEEGNRKGGGHVYCATW